MKKFVVGMSWFLGVALLSCEETPQTKKNPESLIATYKAIGKEIPFETGMRWIDIYHSKNSSSSRTELFGQYELSDEKTLELMASVDDLVGIAFHYGKDAFGQKHIIAIPVDHTLRLWTSIPGRIYVDTNTGTTISQSTANAWAQNYKNQNPNSIWFHFFGSAIFDEIVALPFFNSIDIQPALSDLLLPQMLLVIWNESLSLGRTESSDAAVYDASNPCPPCDVE